MNAFHRDDDDEDWDDDDDAFDGEADDEPTVPCPSCGREILEDSPRCPYCERYLSSEDHIATTRPAWVVVTALLCLVVALAWAFAML